MSKYNTFQDVIDALDLDDESYYRLIFKGARNFNMDELMEALNSLGKNICDIRDETNIPYNFEAIKEEENLKGVFTKKILDEMEKINDNEKTEMYKIIDMIYQMMK